MKKNYTFHYTNTKKLAVYVASGLFVLITLIFLVADTRSSNTAAFMIILLVAFPLTIFLLKKAFVRPAAVTLNKKEMTLILDNKKYEIPFEMIEGYVLSTGSTIKLTIYTPKEKISIPIHYLFNDPKEVFPFFEAFQTTLTQYAQDNATSLIRHKQFEISRIGTITLTLFSLLVIGITLSLFSEHSISLFKSLLFIGILILLWRFRNTQAKKYDAQTPQTLYDQDEHHAKSQFKSIAIILLALSVMTYGLLTFLRIKSHIGETSHLTRDYAHMDMSPFDVALIDMFNDTFYPYQDIHPLHKCEGSLCLLRAISLDNATAISDMLKEHPIDLQRPLDMDVSPLRYAIHYNHIQAAQALIATGAKLDEIIIHDEQSFGTLYTEIAYSKGQSTFLWLLQSHAIPYKNLLFLKITLLELNGYERDHFIKSLLLQIQNTKERDDTQEALITFLRSYPDAEDKDLYVQDFIEKQLNPSIHAPQIQIREQREQNADYQASKEDEKILLEAYKYGNLDAALDLGYLYVSRSQYDKAVPWFQTAADKTQDGVGEYALAQLYDQTLHDTPHAISYYQKAIEKGNTAAMNALLQNHPEVQNNTALANIEHQLLQQKKYKQLIELYTKKYQVGDIGAARMIGDVYALHLNDYDQAKIWYEKLSVLESGKKQEALGDLDVQFKKPSRQITDAYIKALKKGNIDAGIKLITQYPEVRLIDRPFIDAALAQRIAYELGGLEDQEAAYVQWNKKVFKFHQPESAYTAAYYLARYYEDKKAYRKAIKWYQEAKDYKDRYFDIAFIYQEKLHDLPNAIRWYKKDYKQGGSENARLIGKIYMNDYKALDKADYWFRKSILQQPRHTVDCYIDLYKAYKDKKSKLRCIAMIISQIEDHPRYLTQGYNKRVTLNIIEKSLHLPKTDIQKAYKIQLSMGLKRHYEDVLF